jgi:hypothetical protein
MSLFPRMVLGFAVAAALAGPAAAGQVCYFGECGPAPAVATPASQPAAPAAPATGPIVKTRGSGPQASEPAASVSKVLASYGSWDVIASSGQRVVVDRFDDGSRLTIGKVDGKFVLLLDDPSWKLTDDKTYDVQADVDGDGFSGTGKVLNRHTNVVDGVSASFIKAMRHGEKATIEVAGETWQVSLSAAGTALDAMTGSDTTSG